jgi:hypothetical protein
MTYFIVMIVIFHFYDLILTLFQVQNMSLGKFKISIATLVSYIKECYMT